VAVVFALHLVVVVAKISQESRGLNFELAISFQRRRALAGQAGEQAVDDNLSYVARGRACSHSFLPAPLKNIKGFYLFLSLYFAHIIPITDNQQPSTTTDEYI
jgi:hypothetical protein